MSCPVLKNEITYTPLYKIEEWAFGAGGLGDKGTGNGGVEGFWYNFLDQANFTNIASIKTKISDKLEELVLAYNDYYTEMVASQKDFNRVLAAIRGYANMKYVTMLAPPPDPGIPNPDEFGENANLEFLTEGDRTPQVALYPRRQVSHGYTSPDDPPVTMRISSANVFTSMLPLPVSSDGPYGYIDRRSASITDNVFVCSEYVFKDGDVAKLMFFENPFDTLPSQNIWTGGFQFPSNVPVYIVNSVPVGPSGSPEFQISADADFDPTDLATAIIDNLTYTAKEPGKAGNQVTIEYVDTGAIVAPAVPVVTVVGTEITVDIDEYDPADFATALIGDLTYTAQSAGVSGTSISIEYIDTGAVVAPAVPTVDVLGSAITVDIDSGATTTAQISTQIAASGPATALVAVSAGSVAVASVQGPTFLASPNPVTTTAQIATAIGANPDSDALVSVTIGDTTPAPVQGPISLSGAVGIANPFALTGAGLHIATLKKDNSLELIPHDDIRRLFGAWRIALPEPAKAFSVIQGICYWNGSVPVELSAPILRAVDTNSAVGFQIPPNGSVITITHTNINGVKKARNFEATTLSPTGTVTLAGTVAGTTIYYNTTGLTTAQQIIQELKDAINSASGFSLTAEPKEFIAIDSTVTTDIFLQTIPEYLEDGRIEINLAANVVGGYNNAGFATDIRYRSDATLITTAAKELLHTIEGVTESTATATLTITVPRLAEFDKKQYLQWFTGKLGDQLITKTNAIQFGTLSGARRVYQEKIDEIAFVMEDMHLREVLQKFKWKVEGLN